MAPSLNAIFLVQAILLFALIVLAIVAFRATKTTAFLLLMLGSLCYFIQHFAPFPIWLFYWMRGWKDFGSMATWMHSWWWFVNQIFDCLFLVIIIAAFVFFIRERRTINTHMPNQALQPL